MTRARFYSAEPPTWEVVVDITERETHGRSATVSKHALEKGAKTSDHIQVEHRTVSFEVGVSDEPLDTAGLTQTDGVKRESRALFQYRPSARIGDDGKPIQSAVTTVYGHVLSGQLDRVRRVWEELDLRMGAGLLIFAESSLLTYPQMAIVRVGAVMVSSSGSATFQVDLEQVAFDVAQTVAALPPKPKNPNGKAKVAKGPQPVVPTPEEEAAGMSGPPPSLLSQGLGP